LLRLAVKVFEWNENYFVVTSQRMLLSQGLVTKKVNMMPLAKVTDMSFQRSTWGRLLGYGEFIVESAGQDQALRNVKFIPYPEQLYLEVCGLIFKEEEEPKVPPPPQSDVPLEQITRVLSRELATQLAPVLTREVATQLAQVLTGWLDQTNRRDDPDDPDD
jgi:uncharacterized membrane protein YdbT with pleckstrin-like domain